MDPSISFLIFILKWEVRPEIWLNVIGWRHGRICRSRWSATSFRKCKSQTWIYLITQNTNYWMNDNPQGLIIYWKMCHQLIVVETYIFICCARAEFLEKPLSCTIIITRLYHCEYIWNNICRYMFDIFFMREYVFISLNK